MNLNLTARQHKIKGSQFETHPPRPKTQVSGEDGFSLNRRGTGTAGLQGLATHGQTSEIIFATDRISKTVLAIQRMVTLRLI